MKNQFSQLAPARQARSRIILSQQILSSTLLRWNIYTNKRLSRLSKSQPCQKIYSSRYGQCHPRKHRQLNYTGMDQALRRSEKPNYYTKLTTVISRSSFHSPTSTKKAPTNQTKPTEWTVKQARFVAPMIQTRVIQHRSSQNQRAENYKRAWNNLTNLTKHSKKIYNLFRRAQKKTTNPQNQKINWGKKLSKL